jgi:hypothetical protein
VFRDRLVGVEVVDRTRLDVCESGRGPVKVVKAVKAIMVGVIIEIRLDVWKSGEELVMVRMVDGPDSTFVCPEGKSSAEPVPLNWEEAPVGSVVLSAVEPWNQMNWQVVVNSLRIAEGSPVTSLQAEVEPY